jgi:hypothetical protein
MNTSVELLPQPPLPSPDREFVGRLATTPYHSPELIVQYGDARAKHEAAPLLQRIAELEPCLGLLREVYDDGLRTNMRDWQARTNAALLAADAVDSAQGIQTLPLAEFIARLNLWSVQTFGPGPRTAAILDHLGKELAEIAAEPQSVEEWVDAAMLALDGAVRSGVSPDEVVATLVTKLRVNQSRSWPDWRTAESDRAIEHNRDNGGEER